MAAETEHATGPALATSDLLGAARRPAEERGGLEVADRAVRRVIEHASREVPGTVSHSSALRLLAGGSLPHAKVRVDGRRVLAELDVAVGWPAPVSDVAAQVREHVLDEASRLTGLSVTVADVHVHVVPVTEERRRVL